MGIRNGSQRRRKSEAAASKGEDHTLNHREGGQRQVLTEDHQEEIFERMDGLQKRNGMVETCAVPLFSQKATFKDSVLCFVGLENLTHGH